MEIVSAAGRSSWMQCNGLQDVDSAATGAIRFVVVDESKGRTGIASRWLGSEVAGWEL